MIRSEWEVDGFHSLDCPGTTPPPLLLCLLTEARGPDSCVSFPSNKKVIREEMVCVSFVRHTSALSSVVLGVLLFFVFFWPSVNVCVHVLLRLVVASLQTHSRVSFGADQTSGRCRCTPAVGVGSSPAVPEQCHLFQNTLTRVGLEEHDFSFIH